MTDNYWNILDHREEVVFVRHCYEGTVSTVRPLSAFSEPQWAGLEIPAVPARGEAIREFGTSVHGLGERSPSGCSTLIELKLKESDDKFTRVRKKRKGLTNPFALLSPDTSCCQAASLRGKAKTCVELLSGELGIVPERDLPPLIECGGLRKAVRGVFPSDVGLLAELSIKTSQKLERFICRSCDARYQDLVQTWREDRFQPEEVDVEHLAAFERAFLENVPKGWNRRKYPYIPNGCATKGFKRREGGNWNPEGFSDQARVDLVFRDGKHRVVTLYSGHNSSVLAPLHYSLYDSLRKKGWLLVGPPTTERVQGLTGGGDYLSFDYQSATDKIKLVYVRRALECLKRRAEPALTEEQVRCLDVVGQLGLENGVEASSGQPMGSYMSFPLLCLVNKVVVDLALNELLQGGQISFKEWTSHRCLINGDDLLTREPRRGTSLKSAIYRQSAGIGLRTNDEKTLQDKQMAEINSTLFVGGEHQKKVNVGALYMSSGVGNVLEYAYSSTRTMEGFRKVVRSNSGLLSRQNWKGFTDLPPHYQRLCRKDRCIRKALLSVPQSASTEDPLNFFNVTPRPEGYCLTREEEVEAINRRVEQVRASAVMLLSDRPRRAPRVSVLRNGRTWSSVKREKKPTLEQEDNILCVLAREWERKQKERLAEEALGMCYLGELAPSDLPDRASRMIDAIRALRSAKQIRENKNPQVPEMKVDPFVDGSDFLEL